MSLTKVTYSMIDGAPVNVLDYGADDTGSTSSTSAFNAAIAVQNPAYIPSGTYKTDTAVDAGSNFVTFGNVDFTGTTPVDDWSPAFGGILGCFTTDHQNAFVAKVLNDDAPATLAFPTGVTGYGRYNNAGNTAFGVFGRSDSYAAGVATNEFNSFNYAGTPSNSFPPNRSIGTTEIVPVALTVAAGGDYPSCMGIQIGREGSEPQPFRTAMYINGDGYTDAGIFIDAYTSTTGTSMIVKHQVDYVALNVIGVGTPVSNNAFLTYTNGSGTGIFSIKQDGHLAFPTTITQSTRGAAGAAQVLPSNPTGYLKVEIGGINHVIPYYEA